MADGSGATPRPEERPNVPPFPHRLDGCDDRLRWPAGAAARGTHFQRSGRSGDGRGARRRRPSRPTRCKWSKIACCCETGGKRVLFDNGMGSSKLYGPDSGKLLDSLAQAGVDPASIDALVLTHAHSDHCWGTMRDDGVPNYPNATIYMAEDRTGVLGIQPARRAARTQPGRRAQAPAAAARPHPVDPRRARVPAGRAGLGDAGPHARPHGVSVRRAAGA